MPEHDREPASARADLCRFLAACHYEPDPAFAEERLFDSMLDAAARLAPELADSARRLGAAFAGQDLAVLQHDHHRLFHGAPQPLANPHQCAWLAGGATAAEDVALSLMGMYDEGGFEADEDESVGPDHVAVELEFLSVVMARRHEARQAGLEEIAAAWQQLADSFVNRHLGTWVGRFTAAVQAGAATDFYRELAQLTRRFVETQAAAPPAR
jgi:TorA maturation chaperone TorD